MSDSDYKNLRAFVAISLACCLLIPFVFITVLFWSNSNIFGFTFVTWVFIFVALLLVLLRFWKFYRLSEIFSKRRFLLELILNIIFLIVLALWNILVKKTIIELGAVKICQNFLSPFFMVFFIIIDVCMIHSTQKANYFFSRETKVRYPYTKFAEKDRKIFLAEFASPKEIAAHYNKGLIFEWISISILLIFSGRTLYGYTFGAAYFFYYAIKNYKRIFNTGFSKKFKIFLYLLDTTLLISIMVCAICAAANSIFASFFAMINLENVTYEISFIPLYIMIVLYVPLFVIRNKLKKHFKKTKQSEIEWLI